MLINTTLLINNTSHRLNTTLVQGPLLLLFYAMLSSSAKEITGLPTAEHYIHTTSSRFVDSHSRSPMLLRGINLLTPPKLPQTVKARLLEGFWESAKAGGETLSINLSVLTTEPLMSIRHGYAGGGSLCSDTL